jgi:hypothetical protein
MLRLIPGFSRNEHGHAFELRTDSVALDRAEH